MDESTDKTESAKKSAKKPSRRPPLDRVKTFTIALLLLASTTTGFIGGWVGSQSRLQDGLLGDNKEGSQQIVLNESQLINQIAENVGPSVVSVNVVSETAARDIFGFGQTYEAESAGTGFIVSEDGIIVTNRHVVPEGSTDVSVTLADGTELDNVEVIGRTASSDPLDIAFLKVNDAQGKELKPVELGDSSEIEVGYKVVAIGNALGQFQNTVTAGIISGYGRNVEASSRGSADTDSLQNLFQTDAAINQGNSGGPLVNIQGQVIGINTAVAGNSENIGFAIPINDVRGLIESVLEEGELIRPYLGVRYVPLTADYAFQFDLDRQRGAYIVPGSEGQPSVLPDSPAAEAGLQEGDIITQVNGTTIDENNSLTSLIGRHSVGDTVTVTIIRDGDESTIEVTLEAAPQN